MNYFKMSSDSLCKKAPVLQTSKYCLKRVRLHKQLGEIDIEYELIETGAVLEITDVYGSSRRIAIEQTNAKHAVAVTGVAAGVYIVSLRASGMLFVVEVTMLKKKHIMIYNINMK